jgi:hypothetical protein
MGLRTALGAGLTVVVLVACGGGGGSPSPAQTEAPATESNPTEPEAAAPESSEEPGAGPKSDEHGAKQISVVSASPSCAPVGSRVVLKLGTTYDKRSVDCYDVDAVGVVFAPEKAAKVTVMGPMSDGFCAIDVEVPKGAESGKIRVEIGADTFETDTVFPVPCPGN